MKPFLGIDLTNNKKNEEYNGEEFLVLKTSSEMSQRFEDKQEEAEDTLENSKLSKPLRVIKGICGFLGLLILIGILKALGGEDGFTLRNAYENAAWVFWVGGGLLLCWLILQLASMHKSKTVLQTEESTKTFSDLDKMSEAIFDELGVPENSKEVDVLFFFYKMKKGEIKICEKAFQTAPYLNAVFNVFKDDENLYLANLDGKYAFSLASIKNITSFNKKIRIINWNKDTPYNDPIYKPYKLYEDDNGCIHCKKYHIIEVENNGDIFGIYIPSYELPIFEELIGISAV